DLDPNKLLAYGIPINEVVNKVRTSNGDVGGKIFEVGSTEFYVRGRGYIKKIEDIENIPLKSRNGTPQLQLTSNIMSLGGIAIAIGAMVDSAKFDLDMNMPGM